MSWDYVLWLEMGNKYGFETQCPKDTHIPRLITLHWKEALPDIEFWDNSPRTIIKGLLCNVLHILLNIIVMENKNGWLGSFPTTSLKWDKVMMAKCISGRGGGMAVESVLCSSWDDWALPLNSCSYRSLPKASRDSQIIQRCHVNGFRLNPSDPTSL